MLVSESSSIREPGNRSTMAILRPMVHNWRSFLGNERRGSPRTANPCHPRTLLRVQVRTLVHHRPLLSGEVRELGIGTYRIVDMDRSRLIPTFVPEDAPRMFS